MVLQVLVTPVVVFKVPWSSKGSVPTRTLLDLYEVPIKLEIRSFSQV